MLKKLYLKLPIPNPDDAWRALRKFEEMNHRLIKVSGYDTEKLIELFAAGYTLEPPKPEMTLSELAKIIDADVALDGTLYADQYNDI